MIQHVMGRTIKSSRIIYLLLLVVVLLLINLLSSSIVRSEAFETITIAGSVGNTNEAYHFPLYGSGIHVVPNSDPSLLPTFYVADSHLCVVRQIIGNESRVVAGTGICRSNGADSVLGTESSLDGPTNMFYDAPNNFLYILDYSSIRLLDLSSGIMSRMIITFTGTGINSFNNPMGITIYNGDIYVADTGIAIVWRVKITYRNVGTATVFVGTLNGLNNYCDNIYATNCKLIKPTSVTFFQDGMMAIADGNRIIMVTANRVAYQAPVSMSISNPVHVVAYDASNMLISDSSLMRFMQFNKDQPQPNTNVVLMSGWARNSYFGLVKQNDGSKNVYFLSGPDPTTKRSIVASFNFIESNLPSTETQQLYGLYDSFNFNSAQNALSVYMPSPQQMRLTDDNQLYFPIFNSAVVKLDLNSGLATRIAGSISQYGYNQDSIPATIALLTRPNTILKLDSGDLIISDTGNNRIRKIDNNGIITTLIGTGTQGNSGDYGPASQCQLNGPQGLAAPPPIMAGQFIFDFADSDNNRIRRLRNDLTVVPLVTVQGPNGIMYSSNGDLYIASQGNQQIMKYSNSQLGIVAGSGSSGYSGDGGPARNAKLNYPSDVAVSPTGEVYIADWGNNVVRKVFKNGTIITLVTDTALNGVTLTSSGDLFYSTGLRVKWLMNGNSGSCIDKSTCNNHGTCVNGKCVCDSGWRGNLNCGVFSCDITPPSHSFQCIGPNQFSCMPGWTGDDCKMPVCFGIPENFLTTCSSHGQCISNNTCNCESGWRGSNDCSVFSCDVKSEHGEFCIGPNTYECEQGWIGNLCTIPLCNGIPANNPTVCNSHGQCISNNTCNCNSGWKGNSQCTQFTCDGVNNCQPHGQCISNNTCKCSDGYGGNGCNYRMCFGEWGPSGCSNNGNCILSNVCSCFPLYFGEKCEWIDCNPSSNDQSINSTKGCSSNGKCNIIINNETGKNSTICKCNEGFNGQYCQEKSGNGGTIAAVVVCLLLAISCLILLLSIGAFVYFKKRARSKSEELENLIPNSVNDWTLKTVPDDTVKSTASSVTAVSDKSFIRTIRKQLASNNNSTSVSSSTNNTREHFHIREKEYVKSKKLGTGASATVFMFNEITNNEQVAVKIIEILNPNGSEFKEVVNMFDLSEEANPHIVPILGCTMVENGGYICILMPLYKCDLRNWMYTNRDIIPIELIIEIVKQIALALQYLHSKNMVHRDLKQTNIFISKSPDLSKHKNKVDVSSFQLCVGDWGSSRYQTRSSVTAYEGTIQYSSPESIVKCEFSPKSDVWSLGCILYQLLSADYETCLMRMKQPTMNDQSDIEILEKVEKVYSKRTDNSSKLFKKCCKLMLEMIRFNPDERISTSEIVDKLNNL